MQTETQRSWRRAIVFLAWGDRHINEVIHCIERSTLPDLPMILITDGASQVPTTGNLRAVRVDFKLKGLHRKAELWDHLPPEFDSLVFLDSDTVVLGDVSFGFAMAEAHGMAMVPAPHYNLEAFYGFEKIMAAEGVERHGQVNYNSGVIFFRRSPEVQAIFAQWRKLVERHPEFLNDQPFLSLGMNQLSFNPYTLSPSYNLRGLGELISGRVRIWHSHDAMPEHLNDIGVEWPLRRAIGSKMTRDETERGRPLWKRAPGAFKRRLVRLKGVFARRVQGAAEQGGAQET